MKVILYGIGQGCEYVRNQLLPSINIIAYSDSFADLKSIFGIRFVKSSQINSMEFDYVIITMITRFDEQMITDTLCDNYSISRSKILSYFCCCNTELYINKLSRCNLKEIDTLIIGNSHAQRGMI